MEHPLSLVQSMLDLFADESGLSVILTNDRGEWITRPSGTIVGSLESGPARDQLEQRLKAILEQYAAIRNGIVHDVSPGVRLVRAPVFLNRRETYYVWAGCLVDERIVNHSAMHNRQGEPKFPWTQVLASVKQNSADTEKALTKTCALASIVEGLLKPAFAEEALCRRMELLRRMASNYEASEEWAHVLAEAAEEADFIGFAAKTERQRFAVVQYAGPSADAVRRLSFSLGEGFVGQVATSRKAVFWDQVARDPRTFAFSQCGLYPMSLFCVPVFRDRELEGVLFGGSVTEPTLSRGAQSFVKAYAAGWSMRITLGAVREDRNTNFTRLSTFVETCGSINNAQDVKRLSYILVDMSLNLVEGSFSCVVLKQSEQKVQLVSRGLGQQQAERYVKELAARWSPPADRRGWPQTELYESSGMPPVMECPLYYQSELLGIWCIALKSPDQYALYREYMTIVAQAGSASLYRLWDKGRVCRGDAVQLLNRALGYWDSYAFDMTHQAQELALPFARSLKLDETTIKQIGEACLVYPYSPAFLSDILRSPEQMELIGHFHAITRLLEDGKPGGSGQGQGQEADSEFSAGGQIIAMIYFYLQFGGDTQSLDQLWPVSPKLRAAFRAFCDSREVVESEISLTAEEEDSRANGVPELPDIRKLKDLPPLSSREREVLGHVLQGESNREIAEQLVISEHTVKNHMTNIFQKLGVTDRAQAIAMVYKAGWNR
ncbi:LuxR C-terminal-related transcriptional regulator [Paenibacillus sp. GCM10012303]|uniref:LuxR C-terminal-related transcriptional regulator n=1 Tax=Paenibacillus sp. GCM10012303 TaxID=3317340 RepID=UPI00360627C3